MRELSPAYSLVFKNLPDFTELRIRAKAQYFQYVRATLCARLIGQAWPIQYFVEYSGLEREVR